MLNVKGSFSINKSSKKIKIIKINNKITQYLPKYPGIMVNIMENYLAMYLMGQENFRIIWVFLLGNGIMVYWVENVFLGIKGIKFIGRFMKIISLNLKFDSKKEIKSTH